MRKIIVDDYIGQRFGRYTVVSFDHIKQYYKSNGRLGVRKYYFWCVCDCGTKKSVDLYSLLNKKTVSCGCFKREQNRCSENKHHTHGMTNTRLFRIWNSMKRRCVASTDKDYHNYGGRGVKVCKEWLTDFVIFYEWAINNGYTDNLTIDRIDVNGNYEPSNCRWISIKEQCRNKRNNRKIEYNGETHCIAEWADITGISTLRIWERLKGGWSIEDALNKPVKMIGKKPSIYLTYRNITLPLITWARYLERQPSTVRSIVGKGTIEDKNCKFREYIERNFDVESIINTINKSNEKKD